MPEFSLHGEETGRTIRFILGDTGDSPLQAFERDLLELVPRLRRFARALARDRADADDLVQAALERALKARHQWTPGTRLDAWMMKIARNCWIDETRARSRRAQTFVAEEAGAGIGSEAHREIELKAELSDVERAMATLPEEQREAIAFVLIEGFGYREAADLLDIPIGTLTSRLTRGRQALVRMLEAT